MRLRTSSVTALLATATIAWAGLTAAPARSSTSASMTATVTAPVPLQISTDPFAGSGQHQTQVEPSVAAWGRTVVATFQSGRLRTNAGSAGNMWATSTDGGSSWTSGPLPSLTWYSADPDPQWTGAADPSVSYDAASGTWLIASVLTKALPTGGYTEGAVVVSRSSDGRTWSAPVAVSTANEPDKAWLTCDNVSSRRGTCYAVWAADSLNNRLSASTSTDGGQTWSAPVPTANLAGGYDVQPVVQPDGTVVVVATQQTKIVAYRSTDGGVSWSAPRLVATATAHTVGGGMRVHIKPSVDVAGDGRVYAVWSDCRFRASCAANDIVLASSPDGVTWTAPSRIALDPPEGSVEHFLPGFGVDPETSGSTTRLGLTYYWFANAACGAGSPCALNVSYVGSADAGASWSTSVAIGPQRMSPSWLPTATGGRMVGDYFRVAFSNGNAIPVVAAASAPVSGSLRESMWSAVIGPNTLGAGSTATMEGDGGGHVADVPVTLGAPSSAPVTVDYTTADGSATAGNDYVTSTGTLLFPAGTTTATIPVTVLGDTRAETDETVQVLLSNPSGAAIAASIGTLRIVDEEGAPRLSVGNAAVLEGDGGTTTTLDFPLRLSASSDHPVTVTVAGAAGTATPGSDYTPPASARVTFAPGVTETAVPVAVLGDGAAEGNETLKLNLSAPTGAVIADPTGLGTIVDDDGTTTSVPLPGLSVGDDNVAEGNSGPAYATFPLTLSRASTSTVQASCRTTPTTATAGVDYTSRPPTAVKIPAGATTATIAVAVLGDTATEAKETFQLVCTAPVGAVFEDATGVGTIVDDDLG